VVHVAAVDATEEKELEAKYQVQFFPTILIFGDNKAKPEKYEGGRTADAIVDGALKVVRDTVKLRLTCKQQSRKAQSNGEDSSNKKQVPNDVIILTDDNFENDVLESTEPWLIEFFAPWCGHCKSLAPEWARAATELKGTMKLGAVDATEHKQLASKYGIQGFPTIKFFPPGEKSTPIDYDGPRTASGIETWCLSKLDEYGIAPEVLEAISETAFTEQCYSKKVCVVAVLPHLFDGGASARQGYISIVQEVAKALRSKPLAFVWVQGTVQENLEQTFQVGGAGYPALVAISESKMRYSVHRRAFTTDHITTFLRDVLVGKEKTVPFKALPPIATTEPWDGSDYVPPVEEDEL
jgi:protein disulfide-isomerase A6